MLILLTRAIEESRRTAAILERDGHEVIISPVFETVPTGATWPAGLIDGVIATSARAFELLSATPEWPLPEARRLWPLFLVGEKARVAARERGFSGVAVIAQDVAALAGKIADSLAGKKRFLYLAGRDRKPELEKRLNELDHTVELLEVYSAQAAEALSDDALGLLSSGKIGAILHYSRRSTEIFLKLARKARLDLTDLNHVCISSDTAEPLLRQRIHGVLIAKTPDEQAMLAVVNALAELPKLSIGPDLEA
ncbi:MAG TPA: uroporphyrinogen-III synthase [Methylocella sp.]|nr:uroporphyrinogen-III synthase [Methylocella sp.]